MQFLNFFCLISKVVDTCLNKKLIIKYAGLHLI